MKLETTKTGHAKNPRPKFTLSDRDSIFPARRRSSYPARNQRVPTYSTLFHRGGCRTRNSKPETHRPKPISGFLQFFAIFCMSTWAPDTAPVWSSAFRRFGLIITLCRVNAELRTQRQIVSVRGRTRRQFRFLSRLVPAQFHGIVRVLVDFLKQVQTRRTKPWNC